MFNSSNIITYYIFFIILLCTGIIIISNQKINNNNFNTHVRTYIISGKGEDGSNEIHFFGQKFKETACPWSAYLKRFPNFGLQEIRSTSSRNIPKNVPQNKKGKKRKLVEVPLQDKNEKNIFNFRNFRKLLEKFFEKIPTVVKEHSMSYKFSQEKNQDQIKIDDGKNSGKNGKNGGNGKNGNMKNHVETDFDGFSYKSKANLVYTFDKSPDYIRNKVRK